MPELNRILSGSYQRLRYQATWAPCVEYTYEGKLQPPIVTPLSPDDASGGGKYVIDMVIQRWRCLGVTTMMMGSGNS